MSISSSAGGLHPDDKGGDAVAVSALVQAQGVVLVVREPMMRIVQASSNAAGLLQRPLERVLLCTLHELGGDLAEQVRQWGQRAAAVAPETLQEAFASDAPRPTAHTASPQATDTNSPYSGTHGFRCTVGSSSTSTGSAPAPNLEGLIYRIDATTLAVELQTPRDQPTAGESAHQHPAGGLLGLLGQAVQALSEASDVEGLGRCLADWALRLTGCEQAVFYGLDEQGRWDEWAARSAPGFEGAPRPALDAACWAAQSADPVQIQQDTRHDPAELLPALPHPSHAVQQGALDLSRGGLASLRPAQLQALRAQGVGAVVQLSVQRDGQPCAKLVCTQGQPLQLARRARAALALLGEAAATRMAAIEHHAHTAVMQDLRALELRLVEAASQEGDWRQALAREPQALLQHLHAQGAMLLQDGDIFTCGRVPEPPEQRMLAKWVDSQGGPAVLACSSLESDNGTLAALAPAAAQVLAVRLHATSPDWLIWLRAEHAPVGHAPRAAGPAPWTNKDKTTAAAFGRVVADISLQVHAVRLLIAQSQLSQLQGAVQGSRQAMVVASAQVTLCQANPAFFKLLGRSEETMLSTEQLMACFTEPELAHRVMGQVRAEQRPWRGELALRTASGVARPVSVRAEPVPARDGSLLGFIFLIDDLSAQHQAAQARQRLEDSLTRTERSLRDAGQTELLGALLVNAGIAAMDISDDGLTESAAALLGELQASTERAAALFRQIQEG